MHDVPSAPAKVQKRTNAFFSSAIDALLAWGLGRLYKPETYAGEPFLYSVLVTHYFPLFTKDALAMRHRNKDSATSLENPLKQWTRSVKTRLPWSVVEQCHLLQWSRRYPKDESFEEAVANVGQSLLRHREATDARAERQRMRLQYPDRASEDAVLRENKFHVLDEHEEEVLDVKNFDVEEIDSGSEEELGVTGPKHPRLDAAPEWTEDMDRHLIRSAADSLKVGSSGKLGDAQVAQLKQELRREDVEERFGKWWHMYNGKAWKKREK